MTDCQVHKSQCFRENAQKEKINLFMLRVYDDGDAYRSSEATSASKMLSMTINGHIRLVPMYHAKIILPRFIFAISCLNGQTL